MMPRFLAPVGVRLSALQLFCATAVLGAGSGESHHSLANFGASLGVKHVFGASSARAALCLTLKALRRLEPERDVVAMPAYTCFSVAAAVIRAGLKIYPLELIPETLDFDYRELEGLPSSRLLCVITANLFGMANDVSQVRRIAHSKGAFVVDDAAQSLGAVRDGTPSGAGADVGIFSLGRGKPLPAGEGGLMVTNSSTIAGALGAETECLPACSPKREVKLLLKVIASSVFLFPRLYWITHYLKFLKLGVTEFNPAFPVGRLSRVSHGLLSRLLGGLAGLNQARATKASQLAAALSKNPDFSTPAAPRGCQPTYLRFPLLAKNQGMRDRAVGELWRAGIGATPFYPSAICDIEGIGPYMAVADFHRPRAEELSRRLLTLPTHAFVQAQDLRQMVDILSRGLENYGELKSSSTLTAGATS